MMLPQNRVFSRGSIQAARQPSGPGFWSRSYQSSISSGLPQTLYFDLLLTNSAVSPLPSWPKCSKMTSAADRCTLPRRVFIVKNHVN